MKSTLPFPIPESLSNHLKRMAPKPTAVWERYANPQHIEDPRMWPHTVEVFWEWHRRHSGITHLVKAAESSLRLAKDDCSDEAMDLVYGTMTALNESIQVAFADFRDLLEWAISAWQHDPLIFASGNEEENEEAERVEN